MWEPKFQLLNFQIYALNYLSFNLFYFFITPFACLQIICITLNLNLSFSSNTCTLFQNRNQSFR